MSTEKTGYLFCVGLLALVLQSCQPTNSLNTQSQATMTNNTREYYFVLEEGKQRELLQKVSQLKLGDSRADVIARLGAPSHDRPDVTKEGKTLGRSVVYYLKIWQKGLVNEKYDRFIRLEFDTRDHLTKIMQKIEDTP